MSKLTYMRRLAHMRELARNRWGFCVMARSAHAARGYEDKAEDAIIRAQGYMYALRTLGVELRRTVDEYVS